MVALMLLRALVLMFSSRVARLERVAWGGGEPSRVGSGLRVGGRCETQSWTRRETRGLLIRFRVFLEDGLVVMMMTGLGLKGVEGRYV